MIFCVCSEKTHVLYKFFITFLHVSCTLDYNKHKKYTGAYVLRETLLVVKKQILDVV